MMFCFFSFQTVMNNLNPVWKRFKVSLSSLCAGDHERKLQVRTHARVHARARVHACTHPSLPFLFSDQSSLNFPESQSKNSFF